jgi:branched-chain amino acid transport system permease protein
MSKRSRWLNALRSQWLLVAIFIFLLLFPFIVAALTGSSPTGIPRGDRMIMRGESVRWQAVFIELFILATLAMSYNLLFGFTGIISFGHALFFGISGYTLGLALQFTDLDTGTALVLGIVVGVGLAGLLGLLIGIVSLRVRGVYFAIFTLAIAEMFFIFFSRLQLTRAEDGFAITQLPVWLDPTQSRLNFYYIALALVVFTFLLIRRIVNSPTGAVFKAIRENEERAQAIGYNTLSYKLIAIAISGMLAASAGVLQVLLNKKVGPEILSITYTVDPLLMTIIGGIGTFTGPVIGAASLHLLDTVLRDQTIVIGSLSVNISSIWGLLLGAVFITVVMIFPSGIVGTWRTWRLRWKNRPKRQRKPEVAAQTQLSSTE